MRVCEGDEIASTVVRASTHDDEAWAARIKLDSFCQHKLVDHNGLRVRYGGREVEGKSSGGRDLCFTEVPWLINVCPTGPYRCQV